MGIDGKMCIRDSEGREQNIEHGQGEATLDAVVVFDAAYQVACQFAVKEPQGQPHQLGEEIRDERHVDARTDVEQYTAPDHLNKCAAEYLSLIHIFPISLIAEISVSLALWTAFWNMPGCGISTMEENRFCSWVRRIG